MIFRGIVLVWLCIVPLKILAHPWHGEGPSLKAEDAEAVILMLEGALEAAEGVEAPPEIHTLDDPFALFVAWTGMDGQHPPMPAAADLVLLTASALFQGVLLSDGTWSGDADVFAWVGLINPADAEVIAPFMPRFIAWREAFKEALE